VLALCAVAFTRIPPGLIGVRQNNWGGGIDARDYSAGLRFGLKGVHSWHLLDARLQTLSFGPQKRDEGDRPSLEFRTKDNNMARAELSVSWRIRPGSGNALVQEGLERNYRPRVQSAVEDVLRRELGTLSSEDWFSSEARQAKENEILPELEAAFAPFHVQAAGLYVFDVVFSGDYERKLQEKQVSWQRGLLKEAELQADKARAESEKIAKETSLAESEQKALFKKQSQELASKNEVELAVIKARGELYDKDARAQADLSYERAVAEANLALEQAKALGTRLRLAALDTPGGRIHLAQQAAQNLKVKSVTLDSSAPGSPSLLDLDAFVELLLGKEP
jgi:hypothetical protein